MRVALVSTEKLPVPPIRGGAIQTYVAGILPYLARHHQVTVFTISDPQLPLYEEGPGYQIVRFPAEEYPQRVAEALGREGFQVLHLFNRPTWVEPFHRMAPRARILLSLHNEMFKPEKMPPETAERCLNLCDHVVTVSRYIADTVGDQYPWARPKLRPLYSGVDPDAYIPRWDPRAGPIRAALAAKLGFDPQDPVILCVSRLSPKKGQHVLIDAMKSIRRRFPSARLLLVGSRWYGQTEWNTYGLALQEQARSLGDGVIFVGFLTPAEIPPYYTAADLFVCASQWQEPLARVHYEAMAAGLPLVTTRRGGNPEVVDGLGTGLVVDDPANPQAMAKAMGRLLKNRRLADQMGRQGRQLAETRFHWRRVAHDLLSLYGGAGRA